MRIHHRQLFDFILFEDFLRIGKVLIERNGHQVIARHYLTYGALHIVLETKITIRYNPDEGFTLIHHGDTPYVEFLH